MSRNKLIGIIGACVIIVVIVVIVVTTRPTPTYIFSLNISPPGAGSVFPPGGEYESGAQLTLTASPASGYKFVNWTGDVDTIANVNTASTTITINDNCAVFANFEQEALHLPDPNLEAVVREAIDKPTGSIYPSDLEGLDSLFAGEASISNLSGLDYASNLTYLILGQNQISDISPLASLTNLTELGICCNRIVDMSPLANLANLELLSIEENQISDVSPITGLVNLTNFWIENNEISDISTVANLTNLVYLGLGYNYISDISSLAGLVNLELLSLEGNQISDISPLVENLGLGPEDAVILDNNPLSSASVNTYIPRLRARGVIVIY